MFYHESKIHPTWKPFFPLSRIEELIAIEKRVGKDFNPDADNVLRFATTDLDKIRVVILGQDPYPQKDVATGRSFEIGTLTDWAQPFRQTSMKNIVRNLYRSSTGNLKKFLEIKTEIENGEFRILPPNQIFDYWEQQGVLMLNSYLTCKAGAAGSHRDIWAPFSAQLIEYIRTTNTDAVWFLWGKDAQSAGALIEKSKRYDSNHPMLSSVKNEADFLNSKCFSDTQRTLGIDWTGSR